MNTLRLLLFKHCNRRCPGCCNNDWDLDNLPRCTDFTPYNQILLTGGEPMLHTWLIADTVRRIRLVNAAPIYMYTAMVSRPVELLGALVLLDGLTITLHELADASHFRVFDEMLGDLLPGKSLRLNVFEGVELDPSKHPRWTVKSGMQWIENCPLPANETFMRL